MFAEIRGILIIGAEAFDNRLSVFFNGESAEAFFGLMAAKSAALAGIGGAIQAIVAVLQGAWMAEQILAAGGVERARIMGVAGLTGVLATVELIAIRHDRGICLDRYLTTVATPTDREDQDGSQNRLRWLHSLAPCRGRILAHSFGDGDGLGVLRGVVVAVGGGVTGPR